LSGHYGGSRPAVSDRDRRAGSPARRARRWWARRAPRGLGPDGPRSDSGRVGPG